jgi:hypothetical protein
MTWYIVDTLLIALFAVQHSVGTTAAAKKAIARLAGGRPHFWNAIYNVGTFACIYLLVHFWRTSGSVVWDTPAPWQNVMWGVELISLVTFFYLFKFTQPFGEWVGYSQLIRASMRKPNPSGDGYRIKTFGIKRYVRFPHHTLLIVLFWCLPRMTGDLLLLAVEATIYIWLGSLHQDLRGHSYFREQWMEYRRNSRMLFPAVEHIAEDIQAWRARRAGAAITIPGEVVEASRPEAV